jgi:stage V sporulation protein B
LSQSISKKDYYTVERRILQVLRISFILGLATLVICLLIPQQLGQMFYNRSDLGSYIRFAALSAPIYYVAATTYGILNGLGKQSIILRNSLILSILEVILLFILTGMSNINIYGYGITFIVTASLTLLLNFIEIRKHIELYISPLKIILDILIAFLVYFLLSTITKFIPDALHTQKNVLIIILGFGLTFIITSFFSKKLE